MHLAILGVPGYSSPYPKLVVICPINFGGNFNRTEYNPNEGTRVILSPSRFIKPIVINAPFAIIRFRKIWGTVLLAKTFPKALKQINAHPPRVYVRVPQYKWKLNPRKVLTNSNATGPFHCRMVLTQIISPTSLTSTLGVIFSPTESYGNINNKHTFVLIISSLAEIYYIQFNVSKVSLIQLYPSMKVIMYAKNFHPTLTLGNPLVKTILIDVISPMEPRGNIDNFCWVANGPTLNKVIKFYILAHGRLHSQNAKGNFSYNIYDIKIVHKIICWAYLLRQRPFKI
jgi:hypothetical protein